MIRAGLGLLLLSLGLAGCQTATQAPAPQPAPQAAPQYVTRPDFRLPDGAGCSGAIARFRAVIDNDLATGHVNRDVHGQMGGELRGPEAACAAGRQGEAMSGLAAVKRRHGYPG